MTRTKEDPYLSEEYAGFYTDSDRFQKTNSNISEVVGEHLVRQLLDTLSFPPNIPTRERTDLTERAIAMLEGIAPQSAIEGMMAVQMVVCHNTAMGCFRSANLPNQSPQRRDQDLKQGEKFFRLYASQMDMLNKNRGKGQQKITVEHVTVHRGGQAIVGNVQQNAAESSGTASHPPKELMNNPDPTMPMIELHGAEIHEISEKVRSRNGR